MSAMESRISAAKKHQKAATGPYAPLPGQPLRNRYSPYTDLACRAVGVPYGEVQVGGAPDGVHSHEIAPTQPNGSCFLDPRLCREQREERKARSQAVRDSERDQKAKRAGWRQSRQPSVMQNECAHTSPSPA